MATPTAQPTKRRTLRGTIRVARVSTHTRRTLKVLADDFERVSEAEDYLEARGHKSGCTRTPWGDWRTTNQIQIRNPKTGNWL